MDLRPYIDNLRNELADAAEARGGDEARELAERLLSQLEAASRLMLLDVLSEATDEITRELAPGSVHVRLSGREPAFVVTLPAAPAEEPRAEEPATPPPVPEGDDGGTSRINLRLPDHLKASAEEAAGRAGLSLNAWLVRAVARAVEPGTQGRAPRRGGSGSPQHYTGWVR
ncbi:MAG: toxin-antitoxin system HicB family antitoxin [Micromonosporaceae bacterium]